MGEGGYFNYFLLMMNFHPKKVTLGQKAAKIKTTSKLESHPCVVTVEEMAAARHFIKTQVSCRWE